jgi:hypothetical protein
MATRIFPLPLSPEDFDHVRNNFPSQQRSALIRQAMLAAGLLPDRSEKVRQNVAA